MIPTPIHVDRVLDQLPRSFQLKRLNGVARGAYSQYNEDRMHGLPVGVQVVGRRLEEEKVLGIMHRIEAAMSDLDGKFKPLEVG